MNVAIFTPNQNPYSETFIQMHKKHLKGNIFYYYGHPQNIALENFGEIKLKFKLFHKLYNLAVSNKKDIQILKIKKSLLKNKIDVILVEYGNFAHRLIPLFKTIDIPFVVHFHGYDASVKKIIQQCNNYSEVFTNAKRVIAVSKSMYNNLKSLGCPEDKLVYNVYGPNPEFANANPSFVNDQFLAIGRFTKKKAPYYTILSFSHVLKSYPEARLIMIGDGELKSVCENLTNYLGISKNVIFEGVLDSTQIIKRFEESLAFIQHSITSDTGDQEGTPLAVLEAGLCGIPVISTYHAGIPDVIKDNYNGMLVKEHEVLEMSKKMLTLLKNKSLCKEMGANAKANIQNNFSLQKHIKNIDRILLEASSNE